MPPYTRSAARYEIAYINALQKAQVLVNAANTEDNLFRKAVIINELLQYTIHDGIMNQVLKNDAKFRNIMYAQCDEFARSPNCTPELAHSCKIMRNKIHWSHYSDKNGKYHY
jgi:hypothetical protein